MITSTRKALKPCFAAEAHESQPLPARKASRPLCILHTSRWSRSTFPCIACTTARGNLRVQRGQRQKIAHRKFTFCVSYFRATINGFNPSHPKWSIITEEKHFKNQNNSSTAAWSPLPQWSSASVPPLQRSNGGKHSKQ